MRKLKLFLAALALLLGVSNVMALTDVTSTYLTDAALENETTNWALTSSGGNHNWNGDYKYHESWHNTFSLSQTVTLPNGYYQISIQAVNSAVPSTNVKLTAVSGGNSASAYIRHSSAGGFADIAKQFSLNSDACRIYATVKVENGSLTVGFSQPNNGEWVVYGQFKLFSLTETEYKNAVILQTALESDANSWSADWTNGGNQYSYGRERFNETECEAGKIIYKTFSGLPLGNYDVIVHAKANVAWRSAASGDNIAEVYLNDGKYGIPVEDKTGYDLTNTYCYTFEDVEVESGSFEVGIRNIANGGNWYNIALLKLLYKGGCVAADANPLPAGGAMTAGTWYYFDIAVAGDNYNAIATDLSKIIYTTNGNQLSSSATGNTLNAENNSLSATRYYVKSSTDNNLEVAAASYNYNVGSSTLSVANGGYTQNSTFTVTFPDAASNDPDAEVALVASSTATVNGNTVDLEATTNGFTLSLGSLTANTDYVIAIPAGVYGYDGESMNNAINITIHTPAVFDGVYYLYDANNKLFLGRGANYGTRAVADKYGVAMNVATDASGITNFSFLDDSGNKLFDADNGNLYTDNTTYPNFAIEETTGGYYVVNKNTRTNSTYNGKFYIDGSNVIVSTTNSTIWSLLTDAGRDAIVDAYPTDNINTVISAAGISTTAAEFESYLATNYGATDKTSLIGTARFDGSVGDWDWAQVKAQTDQPAYGANFAEVWVATGTYSQKVDKANLPAGIYKVTVDGYERRATNAISNTLGAAGYNLVSSYMAANNEQVRLTNWYDTSKPTNTAGAVTAFNNGEATNELYIYLDGNTDLTIKLAKPNYVWDCWTIFNNFTLTYYEAKATSSEKTALANAIAAAEAKTLGFEKDEYAPYENVDALTKLAAAKALDPNAASGAAVVAATTALTGATWNANAAEVNAIYDGSFAYSYSHDGNVKPIGWTGGTSHDNATDVRYMWDATSNAGLAATTNSTALFTKFDAYYGKTAGYTMPLKANTVYKLAFKYGTWGTGNDQTKGDAYLQMEDGSGNAITVYPSSLALTTEQRGANADTEKWYEFTGYFETNAAGNYVLDLLKTTTNQQNQYVYGDIELKKAVAEDITISENENYTPTIKYANVTLTRTLSNTNWNTFCVPFNIDNATLAAKFGTVEVAEFSEASLDPANATVNFTKMATPAISANVPVLLKTSTAPASVTFNGVVIKTGDAKVAGTNFDFVGSYNASTFVTTGNYYLSANKLYKSAKDDGTFIKGTRAYIKAKTPTARIANFFIDDETTGINIIEANDNNSNAIYNLNGQKIQNAKKGIFIQNGKKVVMK